MHKEAFTPKNAAMLLIDHQVGTMAWTHSHDINLVKKNALRLARIAKAVGMPVALTASMEDQVQGPLVPELEQILRKRLPNVSSGQASSTPCTMTDLIRPSGPPVARS
jgi:nicotinamidase-related amidase